MPQEGDGRIMIVILCFEAKEKKNLCRFSITVRFLSG